MACCGEEMSFIQKIEGVCLLQPRITLERGKSEDSFLVLNSFKLSAFLAGRGEFDYRKFSKSDFLPVVSSFPFNSKVYPYLFFELLFFFLILFGSSKITKYQLHLV